MPRPSRESRKRERVLLPNTKLVIGASTQYNQHAAPGDQRPRIALDVPVVLRSTDCAARVDPVLDAALSWQPRP